ncbi:MAG TPA: PIN domain-containing protein, partial [Tepidiformaceae bacterium]|nr:PIN domain-containing protein [Tepidiformaceae bacterium]
MNEGVVDASPVLAAILDEPGAGAMAAFIGRAVISAVNLAEIDSKLAERGLSDDHIHQLIDNLRLRVIPLSESQAFLAGQLR